MKNIKTLIILLILIILCSSVNTSLADLLLEESSSGTKGYVFINSAGEPYSQKITIPDDVVQLTGISVYVDESDCGDVLYGGVLAAPLPNPNSIGSEFNSRGLAYIEIAEGEIGGDGWVYIPFEESDMQPTTKDHVNVTEGETYYIFFLYAGYSQWDVEVNTFYLDDSFNFKKDSGSNTWEDATHIGSTDAQLSYRLWGKKYDITNNIITTINTTNAYAYVNLNHLANESTEIGHWLGTSPVSSSSFDYNFTTADYGTNQSSTGTVGFYARYEEPYLTPATYYYLQFWAKNNFGFIEAPGNLTFLTKPDKPTNFTASVNNTNITFEWTKAAAPLTTTSKTVLVASKTNYPQWSGSEWTHSGVEIYNGTAEITNVFLDAYADYYVSAYTYITASGSPTYWWYSDLFSYDSFTTTGSILNITVKWECNNSLVNLSAGNYYAIAETSIGEVLNETVIDSPIGEFSILSDIRPNKISIITNSTAGEINHDSIIVTALTNPGVDNITMYLPCGEIGVDYGDIARVHIYFVDYTGAFTVENEAIGYIYRYNGTNIEYIHMDFIQADLALRPQLTIGETYYLGVGCSEFNIPNLGKLTISQANEEFSIEIQYSTDPQEQWHYISEIQSGWALDTLYFDCVDTSHTPTAGTENVTLSLYYTNDTLIETAYMDPAWDFNYTKAGLNNTLYYKIQLTVFYNTTTYNWTQSFWYLINPSEYDTIIGDPDDIDIPFFNIFGLSPVRISPTSVVAWTSLIALIIATFALFTFSEQFAGLSIMGVGFVFAIFKAPLGLISDDVLNWTVVMVLIILGLFTIFVYKKRT